EAIRQLKNDIGRRNTFYVHLTLVPRVEASQAFKSKPTQHSVQTLRGIGIQPDAILCRSREPLGAGVRDKIDLFADVEPRAVISVPDVPTIYQVPLLLEASGLGSYLCEQLGIETPPADLGDWERLVERMEGASEQVVVGVAGKYVALPDAYISVVESLRHAAVAHGVGLELRWINTETLSPGDTSPFEGLDGLVIPGGFGHRGIEGKITASRYARQQRVPFLGLCLGMQCASIDIAREVLGTEDANSTEFNAFTENPVIDLLPEQRDVADLGGTMRLGLYPCKLQDGTKARAAYQEPVVYERHRHRFEFNNRYREPLERAGVVFSGTSPTGRLVEIMELRGHPFFVGSQFHPEFRSRPHRPHPLFFAFMAACLERAGLAIEPELPQDPALVRA
ncbi:MAG: CTP synthase, partial [Candidatus Dormibacteria bacterium]